LAAAYIIFSIQTVTANIGEQCLYCFIFIFVIIMKIVTVISVCQDFNISVRKQAIVLPDVRICAKWHYLPSSPAYYVNSS